MYNGPLNPSVVIRSFWGTPCPVTLTPWHLRLNPSVVIRSFWGPEEYVNGHPSYWGLNPSVVIRSFWGVIANGDSIKVTYRVSIPPW